MSELIRQNVKNNQKNALIGWIPVSRSQRVRRVKRKLLDAHRDGDNTAFDICLVWSEFVEYKPQHHNYLERNVSQDIFLSMYDMQFRLRLKDCMKSTLCVGPTNSSYGFLWLVK